MTDSDVYDLADFAEKLRQQREGHQRLYDQTSGEADRAYVAAFSVALHELFLSTLGDHGEPLGQYTPREK
ncbi:hypothetical protein H4696_008466 [Amycolatopsis lexingtonensis]|uniref:Uncharacterized protein n=1 Tax=Amycolatopsis lexingtonensis TaxID=218822 RepID=A0ABR9IDY5_9PSEU|nr:hypothetical protein [Amycolatopsis lexingtonensis]MBE1501366.1 hypothetical protein [Amycolatopsis lexingtonensis]